MRELFLYARTGILESHSEASLEEAGTTLKGMAR